MSRASKEMVQTAVMGFGIPVLLLVAALLFIPARSFPQTPSLSPSTTANQLPSIQQPTTYYPIHVLIDGRKVTMDLEEYVLGAVLAEMPASFSLEALKAQAVSCRTYGLLVYLEGKKHIGAICNGSYCCQGYLSPEGYVQQGWSGEYVDRVRIAVEDTAGQVLTYDGKLIRATYFSCSGGMTESAVAVWGSDYPYLQAVESPGEEETFYYTYQKKFTTEEFLQALGISLSGSPESWFGSISYTSGGGIDTMQIGGVIYRGTTLRKLLGLRSTNFTVVVSKDSVVFETKGNGHRVGMSQYGANAMAKDGADYQQILAHYYRGTSLVDYSTLEAGK